MRVSLASLPPLLLLACGSPRDPAPSNVAAPTAVRVAPTDPLGAIGLATTPSPAADQPAYVLVSPDHPLVAPTTGDDLGPAVSAIGVRGGVASFTAGTRTQLPFGCDDNQLDVVAFAGPRLPPGPAWILPPKLPPSWAPTALAITAGPATASARRYDLGPLRIELVRDRVPARGTLSILRGDRRIYTAPFERVLMDGAESAMATLDLAAGGPAIPTPIGAWTIAPGGPVVVVLHRPGWEGHALETLLVDDDATTVIEAMSTYLYQCAF